MKNEQWLKGQKYDQWFKSDAAERSEALSGNDSANRYKENIFFQLYLLLNLYKMSNNIALVPNYKNLLKINFKK